MKIQIGPTSSTGAETMTEMACYRHTVFVERPGCKLQSKFGRGLHTARLFDSRAAALNDVALADAAHHGVTRVVTCSAAGSTCR